MLAFLETNGYVYVSASKRLELCNGGHGTPQNLTSFCYLTFALTNHIFPATLARWLKELMHLTGIDTSVFNGHSRVWGRHY